MRKPTFAVSPAVLVLAILAVATPAAALDCRVADPTGTPLNIRLTPNGRVVATARNGSPIQVFAGEDRRDRQGRLWHYVALPGSSAPDGYAIASYIRCWR